MALAGSTTQIGGDVHPSSPSTPSPSESTSSSSTMPSPRGLRRWITTSHCEFVRSPPTGLYACVGGTWRGLWGDLEAKADGERRVERAHPKSSVHIFSLPNASRKVVRTLVRGGFCHTTLEASAGWQDWRSVFAPPPLLPHQVRSNDDAVHLFRPSWIQAAA